MSASSTIYRPRVYFHAGHSERTLPVAVAVGGVALWLLASAVVIGSAPVAQRPSRVMLETLVIAVPIATGLYASRYAVTARFGYILIGIGGVWSLTALGESSNPVPYSVGRVVSWLIFPLLVYAMLAFPDGRVAKGIDRWLLGAVALVVGGLFIGTAPLIEHFPTYTPWASCRAECPANAFFVLDAEPAVIHDLVQPVRETLAVLLFAAVTAALWRRSRASTRLQRRMLTPVLLMGLLSTVALAAFFAARWKGTDPDAIETLGALWSLTVPGVAAAVAIGLVRHHLLLGEVLGRLSGALAHLEDRGDLRRALVKALDDPTVELLFRTSAPGRWSDVDGNTRPAPALAGPGRGVTRITDDGDPLAAIVHDSALIDDRELLDAVGAQVLTSFRHERVTGRLAVSLAELDESRKRIAAVADLERSRIERDLHDGAQQRLVLLRIKLSLAEELVLSDPAAAVVALSGLGGEIDAALDELRSLAHGVYPSVLSDRGLEDALRSVVLQSPLPVRLEVRTMSRHAPEVETAVYFTCVEALQNTLKHAVGSRRVWLTVTQTEALRFEIGDDGPGFSPPPLDTAGGLRNMRDRVEAVGGRLTVDSAPGHGTRIRGVIPLA